MLAGMSPRSNTENLTLPMEPELRAALDRSAEKDQRPVGSLIRLTVGTWLSGRVSHGGDRAGGARDTKGPAMSMIR
jgi:hypothetical protein